MNTRQVETDSVEWRDPFPEPRLFPSDWDLSEFMAIPWPFAALETARTADSSLYLVLSNMVRAMLARVGNFVSAFSHSIAMR